MLGAAGLERRAAALQAIVTAEPGDWQAQDDADALGAYPSREPVLPFEPRGA